MRVLLTAHAFPPRSTAGVEVYTLRLAKALRQLDHEVVVLAAVHDLGAEPYGVRRREQEGVSVVEVVNLHQRGTLAATYDDPGIDRVAAGVLREFHPEVVHAQHLLNLSAGVLGEARRSGARVLVTLHDYWLSCPRDGLRMRADLGLCSTMDHSVCATCLRDSPYLVPGVQRRLVVAARGTGVGRSLHRISRLFPTATAMALRLARRAEPTPDDLRAGMDQRAERLRGALGAVERVIAPTKFVRDRALEFGVPAEKLIVSAYGAVHGPTRARRAGPRRRVGFVGTVAPHKGVHVLLQAFLGLPNADATLDVFGSTTVFPAYASGLRRLAEGDGRVRFRGSFAEGEQPGVLERLDVLVVPSIWWENSPIVALEALAAGLPAVASATGGVPEIVEDGVSGRLVPPGDVLGLREALRDVIEGRSLGDPLPPLPLKTVEEGARELARLYAR